MPANRILLFRSAPVRFYLDQILGSPHPGIEIQVFNARISRANSGFRSRCDPFSVQFGDSVVKRSFHRLVPVLTLVLNVQLLTIEVEYKYANG